MHLARREGWAAPGEVADGVDERKLLGHERINIETIERYHYQLADDSGWVELTGGGRRTDLPMFLVVSHFSDAPGAYGHTAPIEGAGPARTPEDPGLIRADLNRDGSVLTIAGVAYTAERFRVFDAPPQPGIKLCGLWIDGERQYGVTVYQQNNWKFTVPDLRSFADWVYNQIEARFT